MSKISWHGPFMYIIHKLLFWNVAKDLWSQIYIILEKINLSLQSLMRKKEVSSSYSLCNLTPPPPQGWKCTAIRRRNRVAVKTGFPHYIFTALPFWVRPWVSGKFKHYLLLWSRFDYENKKASKKEMKESEGEKIKKERDRKGVVFVYSYSYMNNSRF